MPAITANTDYGLTSLTFNGASMGSILGEITVAIPEENFSIRLGEIGDAEINRIRLSRGPATVTVTGFAETNQAAMAALYHVVFSDSTAQDATSTTIALGSGFDYAANSAELVLTPQFNTQADSLPLTAFLACPITPSEMVFANEQRLLTVEFVVFPSVEDGENALFRIGTVVA